MRVLDPDLVDDVDAEVEVDALVAQNVLVLLGDADHLAAVAKRQDDRESCPPAVSRAFRCHEES